MFLNVKNNNLQVLNRRETIPTIPEEEEPSEEQEDDDDNDKSSSADAGPTTQEETTPLKECVDALEFEIYALEEDMNRERDCLEKQKAHLEERCYKADHDLEVVF